MYFITDLHDKTMRRFKAVSFKSAKFKLQRRRKFPTEWIISHYNVLARDVANSSSVLK